MSGGGASAPATVSERLVRQAATWSGINGLLYTDGKLQYTPAPVTLTPTPYPWSEFEYTQRVQPLFNTLVDKVARDREFLLSCLEEVATSDPFVRRLLDIFTALPEEHVRNGVNLGILRSDYMLNDEAPGGNVDGGVLQIEINTIASSFGCLSKKVGNLHRHLLVRNANTGDLESLLRTANIPDALIEDQSSLLYSLPENDSTETIAKALTLAHVLYKKDPNSIIVFVVQPNERNQADQRLLEDEIWKKNGIRVEFLTLEQLGKSARLDATTGDKILKVQVGQEESPVSVVYYRAGYTPDDYLTEDHWRVRQLVEQSSAIKCPNVAYQLAGTKKVQQVLFQAGVVERFLPASDAPLVRRCFAAQYALGSDATPEGLKAVQDATQDGSQWVLKPQREGGGNNYYGAELSAFLRDNHGSPVLSSYVLMQRIFPKARPSVLVRTGEVKVADCISELGVYGTFLGDGFSQPRLNHCAGYLLRTKPAGVDEGGVATGYSVLSSVVLL